MYYFWNFYRAVLSGIVIVMVFMCYCCRRNQQKNRSRDYSPRWRSEPVDINNLHVYTMDIHHHSVVGLIISDLFGTDSFWKRLASNFFQNAGYTGGALPLTIVFILIFWVHQYCSLMCKLLLSVFIYWFKEYFHEISIRLMELLSRNYFSCLSWWNSLNVWPFPSSCTHHRNESEISLKYSQEHF